MNRNIRTIVFIVIAIALVCVLGYTTFLSISMLSHKTPVVATNFRGDSTFTMGHGDSVQLNNGAVIRFFSIHRPANGESFNGSPVGVNKYPPDTYYTKYNESETGVALIVMGYHIFLSPKDNEQQILYPRSNPFYNSGTVMKLISLDENKGTATVSFRSIKNMNLDKSFFIIPIILIIQAMFVSMTEFIIKRRSTNTLYRYTLYRSIIYTIPVLLFATFSDPEWGVLVAIVIFPFIFIESILFSFLAYKIVIKKKQPN